jgi:hypothetical protein
VVGLIGTGMLQALALSLRLLGNSCRHLGALACRLYDLLLFVPLWIETRGHVPAPHGPAGAASRAKTDVWKEAQT